MRIRDKLEEYQTALTLFPKCFKCGRDLTNDRLMSLRISPMRANRFACGECPSEVPDAS